MYNVVVIGCQTWVASVATVRCQGTIVHPLFTYYSGFIYFCWHRTKQAFTRTYIYICVLIVVSQYTW